ncbi:MAG: hypothetical protein H0U65_00235 [Rubrobacter sp.]|nr:hypothetical protein [Rubrobacter sp.]
MPLARASRPPTPEASGAEGGEAGYGAKWPPDPRLLFFADWLTGFHEKVAFVKADVA